MAGLKPPEYPVPSGNSKSHICVENGQYHAYLDFKAAVELLHDFYFLATDVPVGEEISVSTCAWNELKTCGATIGYCEINLTQGHVYKRSGKNTRKGDMIERHKPHGVYSPENDRLDYFVSAEEATLAYETLTSYLANAKQQNVTRTITLFGTLLIHLVSTDR